MYDMVQVYLQPEIFGNSLKQKFEGLYMLCTRICDMEIKFETKIEGMSL
jgi:hypothetical protein